MKQEEVKEMGKIKKQEENSVKMDMWFKRQAEILDIEARKKRMKEEKMKEEKMLKSKEEEMKKARANEAFKYWMKKKEEEKINKARGSFQGTHQGTALGTQTTGSNSTKAFSRKAKIPIGPYSNAKDLKTMQRKILSSSQSKYIYSQEMNNHSSYEDEEEKQEMYSKENIEDSLQELSSIKKDTPAQDQEPDYD